MNKSVNSVNANVYSTKWPIWMASHRTQRFYLPSTDGKQNWNSSVRPILVFGRVPLFYYLIHLPLIHGLSVALHVLRVGHANWLYGSAPAKPPPDAGFSLPIVYLAWIIVVILLYPACQWFADLKRRRRDAWLSYL